MRMDQMRTTRWFGLAACVIFLLSVLLAVGAYEGYDFFGQYLSELALKPASAFFFNGGAILAGLGLAVFFFGLKTRFSDSLNLTNVRVLGTLSGLGLASVGVFPLPLPEHDLAAKAFYVFTVGALLAFGAAVRKTNERYAWSAVGVAWFWIVSLFLGYSPFLQKTTIFAFGVWVAWLGTRFFSPRGPSPTKA